MFRFGFKIVVWKRRNDNVNVSNWVPMIKPFLDFFLADILAFDSMWIYFMYKKTVFYLDRCVVVLKFFFSSSHCHYCCCCCFCCCIKKYIKKTWSNRFAWIDIQFRVLLIGLNALRKRSARCGRSLNFIFSTQNHQIQRGYVFFSFSRKLLHDIRMMSQANILIHGWK